MAFARSWMDVADDTLRPFALGNSDSGRYGRLAKDDVDDDGASDRE